MKDHVGKFSSPYKDLRTEMRAVEQLFLTEYAGFLIGNQCIDFQKQDGITEASSDESNPLLSRPRSTALLSFVHLQIHCCRGHARLFFRHLCISQPFSPRLFVGHVPFKIEESIMANAVERRLNDLLLRDEALGILQIDRKPVYLSCVSNFSNFLDLFRKSIRSLEVGVGSDRDVPEFNITMTLTGLIPSSDACNSSGSVEHSPALLSMDGAAGQAYECIQD